PAVRVLQQPVAAADYRVRHGLVGEAEARREIFEVARDADTAIHAVHACDQHGRGLGVKVGPAVGDFRIRTVIVPAHADVQRELAVDAEVVGDVYTALN